MEVISWYYVVKTSKHAKNLDAIALPLRYPPTTTPYTDSARSGETNSSSTSWVTASASRVFASPQPPPPGVCVLMTWSCSTVVVTLDGSRFSDPSGAAITHAERSAPEPPEQAPRTYLFPVGAEREGDALAQHAQVSLDAEPAPVFAPLPHCWARGRISPRAGDRQARSPPPGALRVFVMWFWTASIPSALCIAPWPPA